MATAKALDALIASMTDEMAEPKAVQPVGFVCFAPVLFAREILRPTSLSNTLSCWPQR
ncbi:hypothetical protein [Paraburkholderia sp. DGU8]|uniref:hypothetical protein n=1 Tax=Paraburkholderia sp. DGU8 TaxID=3161997 RepID=UPI0034678312